jgi:DNA-directed RNA polymerase subunit M/transcription elongation factor TFIIS
VPKAYQCHHCRNLIFLSEDKQETAYARCADIPAESPKPETVKKDEKMETASELKKDIHVTGLMVEKAKLDVELKVLHQNLTPPPKEKTAFEQLEEYYKGMMGNEDAAKKWHAAIDAEFPNDPVEREKRHRVVNQWMTNKA